MWRRVWDTRSVTAKSRSCLKKQPTGKQSQRSSRLREVKTTRSKFVRCTCLGLECWRIRNQRPILTSKMTTLCLMQRCQSPSNAASVNLIVRARPVRPNSQRPSLGTTSDKEKVITTTWKLWRSPRTRFSPQLLDRIRPLWSTRTSLTKSRPNWTC